MAARLPLLHKTPFVLDSRPLSEATSPHAGLLSVSRAFRSLGLPALVAANLPLRKRQRRRPRLLQNRLRVRDLSGFTVLHSVQSRMMARFSPT